MKIFIINYYAQMIFNITKNLQYGNLYHFLYKEKKYWQIYFIQRFCKTVLHFRRIEYFSPKQFDFFELRVPESKFELKLKSFNFTRFLANETQNTVSDFIFGVGVTTNTEPGFELTLTRKMNSLVIFFYIRCCQLIEANLVLMRKFCL